MAVPGKEVELLAGGTDVFEYSEGSFVQNMMFKRNSWVVRSGFGQRAQYDTTFGTRFTDGNPSNTEQGLLTHLGSELFEHGKFKQIVSVFSTRVTPQDNADRSQTVTMYTVQIYDINTQERWEEATYTDTSHAEDSVLPLAKRHGVYETNRDTNRQAWSFAIESPFFFSRFEGRLYFGSKHAGLFVYSPTSFRKSRSKAVNTTFDADHTEQFYSESSVVRRFYLTTGADENLLDYLESHEIGGPVGVAALSNRLAMADNRFVYISDFNIASAFRSINAIKIPGASEIKAITSHLGALLVWTEDEMWRLTIPETQSVASGVLTKVSSSVGCVGQMAVKRIEDSIVWVDKSGVYSTSNGLSMKEISGPIRPFFDSFMTNPLTSYYTQSGATNLNNQQPTTVLKYKDDFVHIAHSAKQRSFSVGFPMQGISLCYTGGQWALWTFESVVKLDSAGTPASEVGTTKNIMAPWLVASEEKFYCIGGVEYQSFADAGKKWDVPSGAFVSVNKSVGDNSYYILEQGRGGAIDRNVDNEDYRTVRGEFIRENPTASAAWALGWVFEEWERMASGYKLPGNSGSFASVISATDEAYWIPVSIWDGTSTTLNTLSMSFYFDHTTWEPIFTSATSTVLDFIVPNERITAAPGFQKAAPTAGSAEVQCYIIAGAASQAGMEIKIRWRSAAGGGPAGTPDIITNEYARTPLILLPFKRKTATQAASGVSGLQINKGTVFSANDGLIAWEQWSASTNSRIRENEKAQPVDWAYKSPQVGLDDGLTYKARGLFIRTESAGSGNAANFLFPNWLYGQLNTILSSDMKGWSSQVIDYTGDPNVSGDEAIDLIQNKGTIRTRVKSGTALVEKVFGNAGVTYGNPAAAATGTLLIDDQEMNTMATSDNVRGQSFSYMLFGHMQDKAHGVALNSVKAVFRLLGNRHRYGR